MSLSVPLARGPKPSRSLQLVVAAGLAVGCSGAAAVTTHAGQPVTFSKFLLTSDGPPGLPADNIFAPGSQPTIDNLGNVGVGALFNGPDTDFPGGITGLYYGQPGAAKLLQGGSPAPGTKSTFTLGNRVNVQNGRIGFNAVINDGPDEFSNSGVLYTGTFDNLQLIGQRGTPIQGFGGQLQFADFFDSPRINDSGYLAFTAGVQGPDVTFENNQGVFAGTLGNIQFIARQGDRAPGLSPETSYFFIESPRLLPNNRLVYSAVTRTASTNGGQDAFGFGIWTRDDQQQPQLVVATGDQAPGYDPGVVFEGVIRPVSSTSERIVYQGFVTGPGVSDKNFFGLWANNGAGTPSTLVARIGDQVTGQPAGTTYTGLSNTQVNRSGSIALAAEFAGDDVSLTNDTGIVIIKPDGLTSIVAREGDLAPGGNQTFDALTFGELGFNVQGQVAFYVGLRNPGDDFATDAGLFIADPNLGIIPIVRSGQFFEVAPGDVRQVAFLSLNDFYLGSGGEDGRPSSFNDLGQLVFNLNFTDGSIGTYVSSPIPAPSALGVLVAGGVMSLRRRRRS